jgi:hypothetical protein
MAEGAKETRAEALTGLPIEIEAPAAAPVAPATPTPEAPPTEPAPTEPPPEPTPTPEPEPDALPAEVLEELKPLQDAKGQIDAKKVMQVLQQLKPEVVSFQQWCGFAEKDPAMCRALIDNLKREGIEIPPGIQRMAKKHKLDEEPAAAAPAVTEEQALAKARELIAGGREEEGSALMGRFYAGQVDAKVAAIQKELDQERRARKDQEEQTKRTAQQNKILDDIKGVAAQYPGFLEVGPKGAVVVKDPAFWAEFKEVYQSSNLPADRVALLVAKSQGKLKAKPPKAVAKPALSTAEEVEPAKKARGPNDVEVEVEVPEK